MQELLVNGINKLGLKLDIKQIQKLLEFVVLLKKWNKTYNLTAITDEKNIIIKHILDSLSIVKFIDNGNILDIGSGAGLPGIILAIVKPELEVSLLDSVAKKCNFMRFAIATLKLENTSVINNRVENYQPKTAICYQQIICRAFANIDKIQQLSAHLLCHKGKYLMMKSERFLIEESALDNLNIHNIDVPYLTSKRYLLVKFND